MVVKGCARILNLFVHIEDPVTLPVSNECPECRLIKLRTAVILQPLEVVWWTGLFISGQIPYHQYLSIQIKKYGSETRFGPCRCQQKTTLYAHLGVTKTVENKVFLNFGAC
jgi:hypothetical protein